MPPRDVLDTTCSGTLTLSALRADPSHDTWIRPLDHLEIPRRLLLPWNWQGGLVRLAFFVEQCGSGRFCPGLFSTYQATNPDTPGAAPLTTGPWTMKSTVRRQTERPPKSGDLPILTAPPETASGRPAGKCFAGWPLFHVHLRLGRPARKNAERRQIWTDVFVVELK